MSRDRESKLAVRQSKDGTRTDAREKAILSRPGAPHAS